MPIPWKWRLVVLAVFDHGTEFIQKKERRKNSWKRAIRPKRRKHSPA
jgi:hypothetical protein